MNLNLDYSMRSEQSQKKGQDLSFLNISALNKSFLEKSSSSQDSSKGESFDMSSESNPYETSSESSEEDHEQLMRENENRQKLTNLHSIEKSNKNISILLSYYLDKEINFPDFNMNIQKMIKKLNLPKFDVVMFYIAACLKDKEDDQQMLLEKIKLEFFEKNDKQDDDKINQIIYSILNEQKKNDKARIVTIFTENSAYFMQRCLDDKQIYYELFQDILQQSDINLNVLLPKLLIPTSILYILLNEKKYDQILFLVKHNVRIIHTSMISFSNHDDMTYEGYLNKPLLKINLKLIVIFYTEKIRDISIIKKFLLDVKQSSQEYHELLKVFIRFRLNSLAKETFRALIDSNYTFDNRLLNFTLMTQNFEFLWFLSNHESIALVPWLNDEKTQKILVEKLYTAEGVYFEYIIYYLKRVKRFKIKETVKRLGETLIQRMQSSRQGQFLYTFYNPLKVVLLVVELLQLTKEKVVHHKNRLHKAHEMYYKFAQIYCTLIDDDQLLIEIFKDIDLEKRKVLYLIDNNKSAIISSTQSVEDAIESMWNGNIAPKTNLLKMFTITQNLFFSEMSDYMMEKHPKKNDVYMVINPQYQNHHFSLQRVVWTYNCRIRNQIDQILILILMILIFANFSYLFSPQYDLQQLLSASNYNYSEIEDQELAIIKELKDVYFSYQIILDVIIGFNFTFKPIYILYFDWTQKAQTKFSVQDFFCFLLGVFSFFQWIFFSNIEDISEPYRFDILVTFRWLYITTVLIQCILSIKNFKVFGPMIKALWLVILECQKITFIFIVVIVLFGYLAYFSFYENVNGRFTSLQMALLYLTEALFGQFSFADFNQPSPIYAPIFLNIYLFFAPIIMMQLLVAVLTFTFEAASRSGRIHYFLGTIENLRFLEYDAVNGCLVTLPLIGNFLNIIFIFTQMFSDPHPTMKEKNIDTLKKVNRALVRFAYFPIYIVFTMICIVMVIFFSPFFYVVKIMKILFESNKDEGYSKGKRLLRWVLFGYYYMLIQTIEDFKRNYDYLMHGKFVNDSPQVNISNNTYAIVASVTKEYYLKNKDKQNKILLQDYLNILIKKIKISEQKEKEKQRKIEALNKMKEQLEQQQANSDNKDEKNKSSDGSQEENSLPKEKKNGLTIPKQQSNNENNQAESRGLSQSQLKNVQTLQMIKEGSIENTTNAVELRNSQRNQYFANKIKSLITEDSEDERLDEQNHPNKAQTKSKEQNGHHSQKTNKNKFSVRQKHALTENFILEDDEYALATKTQDDLPKRKSKIYEDEKQFKLQVEQIKQENVTKSKTDASAAAAAAASASLSTSKKGEESFFSLEKKVVIVEDGNQLQKDSSSNNLPKLKFDIKDLFEEVPSQSQIEKGGSLVSNFPSSSKIDPKDNYRMYVQQSNSVQQFETSMPANMKKRRQSTFQIWKKLKNDDNSIQFLKDTENLYQFLDAFVVDEDEPLKDDSLSDYSFTEKEENENIQYVYIESLLKLMYHYSKNDVKLARFNILFQAVKKLFKEQ